MRIGDSDINNRGQMTSGAARWASAVSDPLPDTWSYEAKTYLTDTHTLSNAGISVKPLTARGHRRLDAQAAGLQLTQPTRCAMPGPCPLDRDLRSERAAKRSRDPASGCVSSPSSEEIEDARARDTNTVNTLPPARSISDLIQPCPVCVWVSSLSSVVSVSVDAGVVDGRTGLCHAWVACYTLLCLPCIIPTLLMNLPAAPSPSTRDVSFPLSLFFLFFPLNLRYP